MAAEDMSELIESYLAAHPEIARALAIFRMTMEEYRRAFFEPKTYSANTTNYPEGVEG